MRLEGLGLKVNATAHEWLFVFARCISRPGGESAGVCLLRSSDMAKDFVHDADKRLCCIDYDAIVGYVFFCGV